MGPHRITAKGAFWRDLSVADDASDGGHDEISGSFRAGPLPPSTKTTMDRLLGSPAEHVSVWLSKHGRDIKPKLSAEQTKQTQQCFMLMDADGSGAIDSGELSSAFKLLGIKASQREIEQMLLQAGAGESGEVGYDAFVQIMTAQLLSPDPAKSTQRSAALSFDTTVNEYRRKKIIAAVHERDKVLLGMLSTTPNKPDTKPATQHLGSSSEVKLPDVFGLLNRPDSASSAVIEAALKEQQSLMSGLPALHAKPTNSKLVSSKAAVQRHFKQSLAGSAIQMTAADGADAHKQFKSELKSQHMPCRHTVQRQCVSSAGNHLAALKALGKKDSILCTKQPIHSSSNKGLSSKRGGAIHAAMQQQQQPQKKKAIDMFGVAVDDSMQGTCPGLMILRPASSLR